MRPSRPLFAYAPRVRLTEAKISADSSQETSFPCSVSSRDRLAPGLVSRSSFSPDFTVTFSRSVRQIKICIIDRRLIDHHSLAPGETLINEIHLARRWKGLLSAPSSSPSKRNCFPFTAPFFFFSPISWTSFFEWRPIINDTWPNLTKRKGKGYTFFSFLFSFSHTKSKSRFFFERRKSVIFVYVTSIIVSSRCYHVISDKGWK